MKFKKLISGLAVSLVSLAPVAAAISCGAGGQGAKEGAKNYVLVYYDTQRNKSAQVEYWNNILKEYKKTDISKKMELQVRPFDRIAAIQNTLNTWGAISNNTPDILLGEPMNGFQLDSAITHYAKRWKESEVLDLVKGSDYKGDGTDISANDLPSYGWNAQKDKDGNKYYNAVPFGKAGQVMLSLEKKTGAQASTLGSLKDTLQGASATANNTDAKIQAALENGDIPIGQDGIKPSDSLIMLGAGWMAAPWLTAQFNEYQPASKTYDDNSKLYHNVNDVIYGSQKTSGTHITEKSDGTGNMQDWWVNSIDSIYSSDDTNGKLGFDSYPDATRTTPAVADVFQLPYIDAYFNANNKRNFYVTDISMVAQIEKAFNDANGSNGKINHADYNLKAYPLPKQWKFNGKTQDLLTPFNTLEYFVNNRAWGFNNTVKQEAIIDLLKIINKPVVANSKYAAGYVPFNEGAIKKIVNDSSSKTSDIQKAFLRAKGKSRGKTQDNKSRDFRYQMGDGLSFGNNYYTYWGAQGWWASNTSIKWQDSNNQPTKLDEAVNLQYVDKDGKVVNGASYKSFQTFTKKDDESLFIAGQFRNLFKNAVTVDRAFSGK